jgi:hypothetical protein
MKRVFVGVCCGLVLLGTSCSSSASSKTAGTGANGGSTPATGEPTGSAAAVTAAPLGSGVQFGGDVCTALTKADIESATYAQGPAVFASTEPTKDSSSGKTVECHYLATFNGGPSVIAANVSLMDPSEYANRDKLSIVAPPAAITGVGSEAFIVQPAPGTFEAWVKAANGYFKVTAQSKDTATALATTAVARN